MQNLQALLGWGAAAGIVLVAVVAYALLRGWTFAKWMRRQIRDEIREAQDTEPFREVIGRILTKDRGGNDFRLAVIAAATDQCKHNIEQCIRQHNESAEAHGSYRRMADAFVRMHVAEEQTKHNESFVAHHVALANYPDRKEVQGAISRLEQTMANNHSILLERLNGIAAQISDLKARKD